jgi:branched-chain amino acid transport system permease protein
MVDGLSVGSVYALAALGIGLIFGVLRLINFAHGDYITFGIFALIVPSVDPISRMFIGKLPWPLLIITILAISIFLAVASERLVFRPLRMATPATLMVGSFSLGYIIQHTLLMLYGSRGKSVGLWSDLNLPIEAFGLRIPQLQIVIVATTAVLLVTLVIFLKRTKFGIEMRASAEDFRMARMLGVRANFVIALAFGLSGLLVGVISLLYVTQMGIADIRMGIPLMLYAFVATVMGGMGSLLGAVIGGVFVGFVSVLFQAFLPFDLRQFRDAFVFGVVIIILLIRPQGLIQVRAVKERV